MSPFNDDGNYKLLHLDLDELMESIPKPHEDAKAVLDAIALDNQERWREIAKSPLEMHGFSNFVSLAGWQGANPITFSMKNMFDTDRYSPKRYMEDFFKDSYTYGAAGAALALTKNPGLDLEFMKRDFSMPFKPMGVSGLASEWVNQFPKRGYAAQMAGYVNTIDWAEMVKPPKLLDYFPKYDVPIWDGSDLIRDISDAARLSSNLDMLSEFQQLIPTSLIESVEKSLSLYGASSIDAAVSFAAAAPGIEDAIDDLIEEHPDEVEELTSTISYSTLIRWDAMLRSEKVDLITLSSSTVTGTLVAGLTSATFPLAALAIVLLLYYYVLNFVKLEAQIQERQSGQ